MKSELEEMGPKSAENNMDDLKEGTYGHFLWFKCCLSLGTVNLCRLKRLLNERVQK